MVTYRVSMCVCVCVHVSSAVDVIHLMIKVATTIVAIIKYVRVIAAGATLMRVRMYVCMYMCVCV